MLRYFFVVFIFTVCFLNIKLARHQHEAGAVVAARDLYITVRAISRFEEAFGKVPCSCPCTSNIWQMADSIAHNAPKCLNYHCCSALWEIKMSLQGVCACTILIFYNGLELCYTGWAVSLWEIYMFAHRYHRSLQPGVLPRCWGLTILPSLLGLIKAFSEKRHYSPPRVVHLSGKLNLQQWMDILFPMPLPTTAALHFPSVCLSYMRQVKGKIWRAPQGETYLLSLLTKCLSLL